MVEIRTLYDQDKNLKVEDVKALMDWAKKQPHLPKINEYQTILFLHSSYYKNEAAKITIDNFFTLRTHNPEMFKIRNSLIALQMDICLITVLPRKTPEGYSIIFIKFLEGNSDKFNFHKFVKYFDMVFMTHLFQEGPSDGYVIVLDIKVVTFSYVTKAAPNVKTFFYYLQEAAPIRLKGLHFHNIVSFMDKILMVIKPFMKKEVIEMLHLHNTVDSLIQFIPLNCLPEDYGGSEKSISVLHENIKLKLEENTPFFEWEESLKVDESKRIEGTKDLDLYGVQGSFKRLELD